jgi:12,18-didecarboxysiroheme deacetylase
MIGISKLYLGTIEPSDALRYGRHSGKLPSHLLQFSADKKPVVVWNCTRRCNLACIHCYAGSNVGCTAADDLSHAEALALIDDLARFGAPVLLFSGGEPLMRPDLPELARRAVAAGMRAVVSTNGTLIDDAMAVRLKEAGISYAGISLDGLEATHDHFRGVRGSFRRTLEGIRACQRAGLKVGLRLTITRHNVDEIPGIFALMKAENIPRVCFYHLVYSGRGAAMMADDLDLAGTRRAVDMIIDQTVALQASGHPAEVLTVDNHSDGPYLYLRMLREGNPRAEKVLELLRMNGGNSTGLGIGCISWNGDVHPDQFWREKILGSLRDRPFSEIWNDPANEFLAKLKEKRKYVTGRCATCRFLDICGGNFRARAEAVTGDLWAPDPACYLTDEEIAKV